jgi:hypothetical protein
MVMSVLIPVNLVYFQEGNQAGWRRTPIWLNNYVQYLLSRGEYSGVDEIPLPAGIVWDNESITFPDEQTLVMFIMRWL